MKKCKNCDKEFTPIQRGLRAFCSRWCKREFKLNKPSLTNALVLSNPKSGLNWLRHCCERATGHKTPGITHLYLKGTNLFKRTHHPLNVKHHECKLILILRNYHSIFVRIENKSLDNMKRYCNCIIVFDKHVNDKLLIRYEDLIVDFSQAKRFLDFIGIGHDFSKLDLEEERKTSLDWYGMRHGSWTKKDVLNTKFYVDKLAEETKLTIKARLVEYLGKELFDKYLKVYDT